MQERANIIFTSVTSSNTSGRYPSVTFSPDFTFIIIHVHDTCNWNCTITVTYLEWKSKTGVSLLASWQTASLCMISSITRVYFVHKKFLCTKIFRQTCQKGYIFWQCFFNFFFTFLMVDNLTLCVPYCRFFTFICYVYSDPATLAWQCHSNLYIYNNNNNNPWSPSAILWSAEFPCLLNCFVYIFLLFLCGRLVIKCKQINFN